MKKTSKIFSVVLALVLVFAMAIPAFAADGKITIDNAVAGQDYTIYKMFDFTPVTGDAADDIDANGFYTIADGSPWAAFIAEGGAGADYLAKDEANGTIVWVGEKSEARYAELAKVAVAFAKANDIEGETIKAEAATVEFTGLDFGYYAIDSSLGAVCGLTNTNPSYLQHEKNSEATLEKEVQEDRNGNWYDSNDAAIGQVVNYRATITAGKGVENYVMHDKMEAGLTYGAVTKVTLNGVEVDAVNYVVTAPAADGDTFDVDFTEAFEATLKEKDVIVVEYNATLNENAYVGIEDSNDNEAWLTYGDDNETTHDITKTYTYKLSVDKVDGKGDALKGAGFTLYEKKEGAWVAVGAEIKGEDITTFVWTGLDEGEYKLEETTVPAGYNKAEDIEFTITTDNTAVEGGRIAGDKVEASDPITYDADNQVLKTSVVNLTGGLLPETGGIGTTIFYVVGLALVLGAAVLLITKKRMTCEA